MNRDSEKPKIILSCLTGNILEWFDFAVYGYLTPILATQFFPATDQFTSILLTYSVFAIGFLFRPLGAMIFGHIGDTWGRKSALVTSSLMMAIPTFCIGLLPNYEAIGLLAPALLITCRIFQGISIGGEFTGSIVYLVEQGTPGRKGFFSCWADIGCYIGMILGSICVALLHATLSKENLASFGWRLPFLSGLLLSVLAVYIRSHLSETLEFETTKQSVKSPSVKSPLKQLFKTSPKALFFSSLLAINTVGYYILIVFIPNQTVILGKLQGSETYLINAVVLLTITFSTFICANLCDYLDKTKLYLAGTIGCLLLAYPTFYGLNHFDLNTQVNMMCLMALSLGFCYGSRPLFMVSIFPAHLRFSAIAIALNLTNAVFGGFSPMLATYLVEKTGSIEIPAVLIIIACCFTIFAIVNLSELARGKTHENIDPITDKVLQRNTT